MAVRSKKNLRRGKKISRNRSGKKLRGGVRRSRIRSGKKMGGLFESFTLTDSGVKNQYIKDDNWRHNIRTDYTPRSQLYARSKVKRCHDQGRPECRRHTDQRSCEKETETRCYWGLA